MSRIVVTGAAGFLGSHLCDALLQRGDVVLGLDNLATGSLDNLADARASAAFTFREYDVCQPFDDGTVHAVVHLASPASPPDYLRLPIETLRTGSHGTEHALDLAERYGARFVVASTSEVYGDPTVHPQHEEYWGNVNPVGPRSVYDEAKRFGEALTMAYARTRGVNAGIVRIFNTYGPRLRPGDGRVVSNFITQALARRPLTIYGDGRQTRSFCYVDDLVAGLVKMIDCDVPGPVNLGNPAEVTISDLAELVVALTGTTSAVDDLPLPVDDPVRRRPDIGRASRLLDWTPTVQLADGLQRTIDWFTLHLLPSDGSRPT